MRKPVPVLKVGDKVTEYSESSGIQRIVVVTKDEHYIGDGRYFVQYPGVIFEITYRASDLREPCSRGRSEYARYIRPYKEGDEYMAAVTDSKRELRCFWYDVVDKITTMEQCEELKRIFEEIKKEYENAKKQEND